MKRFVIPLSLAGIAALGGCSPTALPVPPPPEPLAAERVLYQWHDDRGPGEVRILINLDAQRAYYTRGERPIGWSYVATGRHGFATPAGSYRITEKIVDKYSTLYGRIENAWGETIDYDATPRDPVPDGGRYVPAPMPFWMRLTSYGIGMHAGPIPRPGSPASHGCIRLPKPFAPLLFDVVKVGTRVRIESGPAPPIADYSPGPPPPAPAASATRDGFRVVPPDAPWLVAPEGNRRSAAGWRERP